MRLTAEEISAIKVAAAEVFGREAQVRLFGSRVDDEKRGGDIDLHLTLSDDQGVNCAPLAAQAAFLERLFHRIEERRVDVVLTASDSPGSAMEAIALRDGVLL